MWSSAVLFVLTFAVLGLLLGFAAVYHTSSEGQRENMALGQNITANGTQIYNRSSAVSSAGG